MMALPHMAIGAAIGRAVPRPWAAYPIAFASHFALDAIPHLDSHGLFGAAQGGPTPLEAAAGVSDFLAGALVAGLLARGRPPRRIMLGGALAAVLMDLVEYTPPFGSWLRNWAGTARLVVFHHRLQHNLTLAHWPLGFGTQCAGLAFALAACRFGRSPKR